MPQPDVATEPPLPPDVGTMDELFLIGVHLEQYRHPTRHPEECRAEALRRDPLDSRVNAALGRWHLRRGEFSTAETHLRAAIRRLTQRNPNPADGEPHYNLGLTVTCLGREEDYAAFYKSHMECCVARTRIPPACRNRLPSHEWTLRLTT